MAKEDFYNWFKEDVRKEIDHAVNNNMDSAMGERKKNAFLLYPAYQQDKIFKETKKLVEHNERLVEQNRNLVSETKKLTIATWFLAIGTLILSGLTLYLTFFTKAT